MSSAGKSFIVTALCRIFSDMGYRVAPFKSQNMALNSGVTCDGKEMGRAQIAQAEAARTEPDVRMNPILLKPNSDIGSQVIVMGKPVGNMKAREYYDYKTSLIPVIKDAFKSLEEEYDVIIVEGAGSPAEINLKDNDIVNMGLAKMLDIPVLLTGDIDLGGVFAQLLGTIEWLEESEKDRIKGLIINKFRGDVTLLKPGIDMLEQRISKKVIGVIPYSSAKIDEEDSVTVSLKDDDKKSAGEKLLSIFVVRLPHMSNFTDFTPLKNLPYVDLKYIDKIPESNPDMIIIPGTKSTISDLHWMNKNGISQYIISVAGSVPIMGICGGNQILGKEITDVNGIEGENFAEGLSLINQKTNIMDDKTLKKTSSKISCSKGFFKCLDNAEYEGYEIHSGVTSESQESDDIYGTYIHGIFDKASVTKALVKGLFERKGIALSQDMMEIIEDYDSYKDKEYDIAAEAVKKSINMDMLLEIMGMK